MPIVSIWCQIFGLMSSSQAVPWEDTGSQTLLAEGTSLKDGSNVLAKIAPATGSGSICLEREAHMSVVSTLLLKTNSHCCFFLVWTDFPGRPKLQMLQFESLILSP